MKLNPDCIRELLLVIEETVTPNEQWMYDGKDIDPSLSEYSDDEIKYHLNQMEMADLIQCEDCIGGTIYVVDITPSGHEFLANIREKSVWNDVKEVSGKIGSASLNSLKTIASNMITELIKSYFGLNH